LTLMMISIGFKLHKQQKTIKFGFYPTLKKN
jgi:hypothetical protein